MGDNQMKFGLRTLFILVGIAAILLGFNEALIKPARERARLATCKNNLRQLALGTLNYESAYQKFPMASEVGVDGKPWHSWRASIFPFLMSHGNGYDRSQPWNAPSNLGFAGAVNSFEMFRCPCHNKQNPRVTYLAITGPGTVFPFDGQVEFGDLFDGSSNTIMFVESNDGPALWAEPGDLSIATMSFKVNDSTKPSISSQHRGGANVAFVDGAVYFMSEEISESEMRALLTIAGGEDISRAELIERGILK